MGEFTCRLNDLQIIIYLLLKIVLRVSKLKEKHLVSKMKEKHPQTCLIAVLPLKPANKCFNLFKYIFPN